MITENGRKQGISSVKRNYCCQTELQIFWLMWQFLVATSNHSIACAYGSALVFPGFRNLLLLSVDMAHHWHSKSLFNTLMSKVSCHCHIWFNHTALIKVQTNTHTSKQSLTTEHRGIPTVLLNLVGEELPYSGKFLLPEICG